MSNLFTQLEQERERQRETLNKSDLGKAVETSTQKVTQVSKELSKPLTHVTQPSL
jgi:hypothetical protein